MELQNIFAVTICIDDDLTELLHVYRPDGTAPTERDIEDQILPRIRQTVHPASTFEITEVIDVQSSLEAFNNLSA
ncbi:hypothetical protein [Enterovibrio norvegicus]|uniref:hypothetical protein n=1 Tax=Enterovibrio norvegicus TaxID=188144 RepID=UPI000C867738|nr:hypothetical protein [Enterovibrio norvegicus]PMH64488.1 hypothetical protein BCU62_15650 [Enterovibrio norvegicus]